MINKMDKGSTYGRMEEGMKAHGKMTKNMDMGNNRGRKEDNMKESTKTERFMEKDITYGLIRTHIMAILLKITWKGTESIDGMMAESRQVSGNRENSMALELTLSATAANTRDTLKMA